MSALHAGPLGPAGPMVRVPGKLFLAGEYAVLGGAPAVLAAADRSASAVFVPNLIATSEVVALAVHEARVVLRARGANLPPGAARVDTSAFRQGGTKLGLGSSAAAAVATVAAAFEYAGLPVAEHSALVLQAADAAHSRSQGGVGSGADVATAVTGGFLRFQRAGDGPGSIQVLRPAPDLQLVTFWTRAAARTRDFIGGVAALREGGSALQRHLPALTAAAAAFAGAFASDARATVAAAAAYGEAMAALGHDAALPIVVPAVAEAAALAASLGGAAKPSGAGGGDMGLAFFTGQAAADAFVARCPAGVLVLEIKLGAAGVERAFG